MTTKTLNNKPEIGGLYAYSPVGDTDNPEMFFVVYDIVSETINLPQVSESDNDVVGTQLAYEIKILISPPNTGNAKLSKIILSHKRWGQAIKRVG